MHDINRTQLETGWETGSSGESAYENFESGISPETYGETFEGPFESSYGEFGEAGSLGETQEMELAAELQEISNEEELDHFIGSIFNSVRRAVGSVLPPGVRNSLGGILKGVAKRFLPIAGAALGNFVAPGVGGLVGGQLASLAGRAFGLELEGLSPEDQEFEVARRYVRLVSDAARQAALMPPTAPPQAIAQQAFRIAAEKHAPGLIAGTTPPSAPGQLATMQPAGMARRGLSGRWIRRGRTLVLYGL